VKKLNVAVESRTAKYDDCGNKPVQVTYKTNTIIPLHPFHSRNSQDQCRIDTPRFIEFS